MRFRLLSNPNLDTQPAFVWRNLDWDIVGRTISSFPRLTRVIVGLDSREDIVEFDNIAKIHMSHLHGTSVFKYALWDPNGVNWLIVKGTWLRASCDSDDTERTPLRSLRHSAINSFICSNTVSSNGVIQGLRPDSKVEVYQIPYSAEYISPYVLSARNRPPMGSSSFRLPRRHEHLSLVLFTTLLVYTPP